MPPRHIPHLQLVKTLLKMTAMENVMVAAVYGGRHESKGAAEGRWNRWSWSS
jgi:hypothetical protein